jgi:LuxR family transcriptional regulator, activator of conjugal transfer of Ti plasmids
MSAIVQACEALGRAVSTDELTGVFSHLIAGLGFERFAYLNARPQGERPVLFSTYPAAWVEHYIGQNYQSVDPVILNSGASVVPFAWGMGAEKRDLRGRGRKLFKEAGDWGIHIGLTVPLHSPRGSWAAITVASGERDQTFLRAMGENRALLQFMAGYYHTGAERLCFPVEGKPKVKLTPREIECLRWTALGKSAWEISSIIRLSETTVTGYIESAKRKLGVFSKSHAVVKAIMEGLIAL